jgi:hypothetical protein
VAISDGIFAVEVKKPFFDRYIKTEKAATTEKGRGRVGHRSVLVPMKFNE